MIGTSPFIVGRVSRHLLPGHNIGISIPRATEIKRGWEHVFCTNQLIQHHTVSLKEVNYVFPLWLEPEWPETRRLSNLSPVALRSVSEATELAPLDASEGLIAKRAGDRWEGRGDLTVTFGPLDLFDFIYAVLHSGSYRVRYADFLKSDFARIPITPKRDLFRELARLGDELVALHLMESPKLDHFITTYTGPKNPEVERVGWSDDTVWLDAAATKKGQPATPGTIGFRGVPEAVWNFHIGGYQVCEKWLKDRKGRTLSKDDIAHYQKIVVALHETIRLMKEIDEVIEKHGGWPGAFSAAPSTESSAASVQTVADEIEPAIREYGEAEESLPLAAEAAVPFGGRHQAVTVNDGVDGDSSAATKDEDRSPCEITIFAVSTILSSSKSWPSYARFLTMASARNRETAMREVAHELGFERTGSRIQERLDSELIAAVRRGVVSNDRGELSLATRTIEDYSRDYLKTLFLSDMGSVWWDREEAINRAARYLGFARTGARIYDSFKSIINGLIRDGRLESDPDKGIRRI